MQKANLLVLHQGIGRRHLAGSEHNDTVNTQLVRGMPFFWTVMLFVIGRRLLAVDCEPHMPENRSCTPAAIDVRVDACSICVRACVCARARARVGTRTGAPLADALAAVMACVLSVAASSAPPSVSMMERVSVEMSAQPSAAPTACVLGLLLSA